MKRRQVELSLGLDEHLRGAAERIVESILKGNAMRLYRRSIAGRNKVVLPVDDETKEWFEETEEYQDE